MKTKYEDLLVLKKLILDLSKKVYTGLSGYGWFTENELKEALAVELGKRRSSNVRI